MQALDFANMKPRDPRPPKGGWAAPPPGRGDYATRCSDCGCTFAGEKRAYQCADCAYGPAQDAADSLAARVHERRTALGLTLDDLADKAGITKSYLWALESGRARSPGAELLDRVAVALEVTTGYLLGSTTLVDAEDEAFRRRYLAMPEPVKAQVRAIAQVLGRMT